MSFSCYPRARDGAQRPGDVGFAPTEAKRRHRTFEARMCLDNTKKDIHSDILFVLLESARRGSNPRPSPWQGDAPPLSHSRIFMSCRCLCFATTRHNIHHSFLFVNSFFVFYFIHPCKGIIDTCFADGTIFYCSQHAFVSRLKIFRHKHHIGTGF